MLFEGLRMRLERLCSFRSLNPQAQATIMWFMLAVTLLVIVAVALLFAYVAVTWDHDVAQSYAALPAPGDLGTKEFRWRCWLSPLTRRGWRTAILRSPCPRITLQCPFALLSADFAKLATSLSLPSLALEQLPFMFPQVAIGSLFLQLLGNSHFPASVREMRLKALTVVQLRPLDMRFHSKDGDAQPPPELNVTDGFYCLIFVECLMVLTEKRFLETEIEFTVQTDLFDDQGTLWQSVTWFSVPFKQEMLVVPLSVSASALDDGLVAGANANPLMDSFVCSKRNLTEFEEVSVVGVTGARPSGSDVAPLMWMLARATGMLQQQARVPALPLMCNCVFGEEVTSVPLHTKVVLESWVSEVTQLPKGAELGGTKLEKEKNEIVKFAVSSGSEHVMAGILRTWCKIKAERNKCEELEVLQTQKHVVRLEKQHLTGGIKSLQQLPPISTSGDDDEITLPVSALEELNSQNALELGVFTFELSYDEREATERRYRKTNEGVLEFVADEGTVGLPPKMAASLFQNAKQLQIAR
ncbi:hypothetical protein BBJ28_00010599 [Nothophytophthora sp. Chile5]|nr:hypothetical protein BBJ28_00010599 [Nothophytophthora sp. Chile5]